MRERNSQISKELSDFINAQYEDFTSLGNSLDGAEEKLEEVTFALMGFRRDAENVVRTITQEDNHLVQLLNERKKINDEIQGGRDLLLFHAALSEAEALVIPTTSDGQQPCPAWEGLDVETDEIGGLEVRDTKPRQTGPQKAEDPLHDRVQQFLYASKLAAKIDPAHPFLESRLPKLAEIKKLVLADLRDGLVTACNAETRDEAQILKQLSSYKDLQETREAITILNDIAKRPSKAR